jgi:hypothetical protein
MARDAKGRHPRVTAVAQRLHTAGLMRCERGSMTVVDPSGAAARVCACYETVEKEFTRRLGYECLCPRDLQGRLVHPAFLAYCLR